jgi:hypothetical protein
MAIPLSVCTKEEQCVVIWALWVEGSPGPEIHLSAQYGNSALLQYVQEWPRLIWMNIGELASNGCISFTGAERVKETSSFQRIIVHFLFTQCLVSWIDNMCLMYQIQRMLLIYCSSKFSLYSLSLEVNVELQQCDCHSVENISETDPNLDERCGSNSSS